MELELNAEKTKVVNAAEERFDFLGFTFHKRWSRTKRGVKYYHVQADPEVDEEGQGEHQGVSERKPESG
jgi:hypothetical protein